MVKENKGLGKAITAVAVLAGVALGGVAGGLIGINSIDPVVETVYDTTVEYVDVPGETITKVVEVPVNVTVEKIVTVEDESFKVLACDKLGYDIISECVEEVEAEDVALQLAFDEILSNGAEELEDLDIVDDEDDISIIKIYDEASDVVVEYSNFDKNKYEFKIDVKYDDDEEDKKSTKTFTVEVEDSEATIIDIE